MSTPSVPDRALVEALKSRIALSGVVVRDVDLRAAGRELVGCCPFHEEASPSFYVNDAKGLFHCFGCSAGGDLIDYVMRRHRLGFADALAWLGVVRPAPPAPRRAPCPEPDTVAEAQAIWRRARPLAGTPAARYLERRGLVADAPGLRFARVPLWHHPATGRPGRWTPALVARAQDASGRTTGIQRICLTPDGNKLPGTAKLSLGRLRGSALRLGPATREMVLCEGPEDGLTLARLLEASVWVTFGASNLASVELPEGVEAVTIAADADAVGRAAGLAAATAYRGRGLDARVVLPPAPARDWNDAWLAAGAGDRAARILACFAA